MFLLNACRSMIAPGFVLGLDTYSLRVKRLALFLQTPPRKMESAEISIDQLPKKCQHHRHPPRIHVEDANFHELSILLIFGPGLQIIIYVIVLASKARHANLIDTTGGRPLMSITLVCLALEANIMKYIMSWSPGRNISNP